MSNWADYHKELWGYETIEVEGGFILYDIKPPDCSIEDFYVRPDLRGTSLAKRLADQVFKRAKEAGVKKVWAKIVPSLPHSTHAMKTNLHYGFKLVGIQDNEIYLMKEIED